MQFQFQKGELLGNSTEINRGMLYGDGYFESMRWHNGKILLKALHEERIEKSNRLLQFNTTDFGGLDAIEAKLAAIPGSIHRRVRLLFMRSGAGFYAPDESHAVAYVQVQDLESYYTLNEKGLNCIRYMDQTKAAGRYSEIKSNSALLYVMASLAIKKSGADEAVIFNTFGRIAEGSSTNLFLVNNNTLHTPSLQEGCVDGVFRRFLIRTAQENGIAIQEGQLEIQDLMQADELWFTSGIKGILWAGNCGEKKYSNSFAQEIFALLMKSIS